MSKMYNAAVSLGFVYVRHMMCNAFVAILDR